MTMKAKQDGGADEKITMTNLMGVLMTMTRPKSRLMVIILVVIMTIIIMVWMRKKLHKYSVFMKRSVQLTSHEFINYSKKFIK